MAEELALISILLTSMMMARSLVLILILLLKMDL